MQKNIFIYCAILFSTVFSYSQTQDAALNYALKDLTGTARFTAMSGAFGALGGDISALKINPAGSSIFLTNHVSFSISNEHYTNDAFFRNNATSSSNNKFDLHQAGAVFVYNSYNPEATLTKFSFGFTYDRNKSLDDKFTGLGAASTSIGNYFTNLANGVPLDLFTTMSGESLDDLYIYLGEANFSAEGFNNVNLQTAYLGYETFIFDAENPGDLNSTSYISNVSGNNFEQRYNHRSTGLNGKFSANGSLELDKRFYLGLNLNGHFINYEKTTDLYEIAPESSTVDEIYFENSLRTLGTGFSFDLGGIVKVNDMLRLGASYKSPTWYVIQDETKQYLETYSEGFEQPRAIANPRVINVFPNYRLRTPGELTGSAAVVFGEHGLLSVDYTYKNYANMKYSSDEVSIDFSTQNAIIDNLYQATSSIRIGGEYRLKNWRLRAGYRYEESPYKNEDLMSALNGYSAGIGYSFGKIRLDFAYDNAQRDYSANLDFTDYSERIQIDRSRSNYVLTMSLAM
ncbi:OmpP1/FadL family transporter [Haloflavibacter putidus]|nr:outer membrane protein transport protein [Haloflavibacter putidus]